MTSTTISALAPCTTRPLAGAAHARASALTRSGFTGITFAQPKGALVRRTAFAVRPVSIADATRIDGPTGEDDGMKIKKISDSSLSGDRPLPMSVNLPAGRLPYDGHSQLPEDESCDPWEKLCRYEFHVYETTCTNCGGSGVSTGTSGWKSKRKSGRESLISCPVCQGIGVVRNSSARFRPELSGEDNYDSDLTIGRLPDVPKVEPKWPVIKKKGGDPDMN